VGFDERDARRVKHQAGIPGFRVLNPGHTTEASSTAKLPACEVSTGMGFDGSDARRVKYQAGIPGFRVLNLGHAVEDPRTVRLPAHAASHSDPLAEEKHQENVNETHTTANNFLMVFFAYSR
jgi:hypothetical protein